MNQKIIREIHEDIYTGHLPGFKSNLDLLLAESSEEEVAKELAQIFCKEYSLYKADYIATFLQIALRRCPNLGLINLPDNILFRAVMITGSKDIYDCYLEEGLLPYFAKNKSVDTEKLYIQLYGVATELNDLTFNELKMVKKGSDYSSAVFDPKVSENFLLIGKEDYQAIELGLSNYNAILGRKLIVKDLETRMMA